MYIYNTYAASDIIIRIIYSDYHQIWTWHSLNIHSFFMPMSKHFFKRQPEQNLRVWVSSLQFPSKLHAKTWKSIKKTMRSSCLEPFLWNQIWHIFIMNWSALLCNCLHNNLNITWFYHLFLMYILIKNHNHDFSFRTYCMNIIYFKGIFALRMKGLHAFLLCYGVHTWNLGWFFLCVCVFF